MSDRQTVHIWDAATGKELRRFNTGHESGVNSSKFSAEGHTLLTAGHDNSVRLWDMATGKKLRQINTSHKEGISDVVSSADGRTILTTSWDNTARLWDIKTGRELRRLFGHENLVRSGVFSADGRTVLTASNDHTARLWDAKTGRELRQFKGHGDIVYSAVFSADGRTVLTASGDHTARLWDTATGHLLRQFDGHTETVYFALFSPDERFVLTGGFDHTARLWDVATGQELHRFAGHTSAIDSAVFGAEGHLVLTASWDATARLWDTKTGFELRRFGGYAKSVSSAVFSPDGRHILTASDIPLPGPLRVVEEVVSLQDEATGRVLHQSVSSSTVFSADGRSIVETGTLWDTATGQESRRFTGHEGGVSSAVFGADGRTILTATSNGTAYLWDVVTGKELRRFTGHTAPLNSAAISTDGRTIVTTSEDRTIRFWDVETGHELRQFKGHTQAVTSAIFSADGHTLLTASRDQTARLWDIATRKELRRLTGHTGAVNSAMFSADERTILTTDNGDRTTRLWDTATGKVLRRFIGHASVVRSAIFGPDRRTILTASDDGTARLWDLQTGKELRRFTGHPGGVSTAVFSPSGHVVLTAGRDRTIRLWNTETGKELVRLMSFTNSIWVVATPDGRFDTNNLEEIKGLHWLMPDDPLRVLPLEIFMRDYYQPRLLAMVLAGERLPPIRSLTELNLAQPTVQITNIEHESGTGTLGDTVAVTVAVTGASQEFGLEGQQRVMETGAYDLRLFRDGQLVAQEPPVNTHAAMVGMSAEEELQHWRQDRLVVEFKEGKRQIVFKGIRLPRRIGVRSVQFSAYAFNKDRVKSRTLPPYVFPIPADLHPRFPHAYVVTVGINAFQDVRWDLSFAVKDAAQLGEVLMARLGTQGLSPYEDVVWVNLTAEAHTDKEGKRHLTKTQANKEQIAAALKTLAGQPVKAEALKGIDHADQLRRANPEDLVIIALSTHGEVDERGRFYLLPHDIGVNPTESTRRTRAISNDDLSVWLQGLDAIDLAMIVDACHSAASVQNADFKPGPMGSRGLGQLAYDKGMRILTATQPDKPAYETQQIEQGVLTYALVHEGLEQHKADYKPKDQQIWLSEWLSYAAERVPRLHNDWGREKGKLRVAQKKETSEPPALQQPALFDFARKRDVLIGRATP